MGILDKLFGGSKSTTTSTQVPMMTPEQQALMSKLTGQVSTGLSGPQPTAPAMSVPQTGQESQYFDWVNKLSGQQALKNLMSGQPGYEVGPEWAEKYFEGSVKPEMMKQYQEVALPALRTAFSGPGYYGSARMGAETKAGSDLAYELAKKKSELQYGEELERRQSIESAYGRVLPTTESMTSQYKEAGEYSRGIEQEKVAEDLQRYLMGESVGGSYNPAYNPNTALTMALLGIRPFAMGTQIESESSGGVLSGLASGLGKAAGAYLTGGLSLGLDAINSPNQW